jgi:16S rRNA (cytosine967-C5)-methyltransferase
MKERMRWLRVKNLLLIQADLEKQPPFRGLFDFILLDVPCTGLGTISSNPEIRWLTEERDLMKFQNRQLTMLANGFSCLKAGGRLVYSTCSSEPEENEMVIEKFLSMENDASQVDYFLRPQPGRSGYFAVCLARK